MGTARYDYVPVVLELLDGPPPGSFDEAMHVVEADIDLPSGKLAIIGCTQLLDEVEPLHIDPGSYRLRVKYMPDGYRPSRSYDFEPGDFLEYRIEMWRAEAASGVKVLKQGSTPWAG